MSSKPKVIPLFPPAKKQRQVKIVLPCPPEGVLFDGQTGETMTGLQLGAIPDLQLGGPYPGSQHSGPT